MINSAMLSQEGGLAPAVMLTTIQYVHQLASKSGGKPTFLTCEFRLLE
jgi:hypothetical protein